MTLQMTWRAETTGTADCVVAEMDEEHLRIVVLKQMGEKRSRDARCLRLGCEQCWTVEVIAMQEDEAGLMNDLNEQGSMVSPKGLMMIVEGSGMIDRDPQSQTIAISRDIGPV